MPRRNRNSGREPLNRDHLIDEAIHLSRLLTQAEPVTTVLAWVDAWQTAITPMEGR